MIDIHLDKREYYSPGDFLICEYQIQPAEKSQISSIEASVLWSTEGKGEEDIGVHFFERKKSLPMATLHGRQRLSTVLPSSPLSYRGRILSVNWFVRVRLFFSDGETVTENHPFNLGPGCYFENVEPICQPVSDEEGSPQR
jgi:hypothetical protein